MFFTKEAKTGKDISCYLKKGQLPGQWETEDASGWASGVLVYSYWPEAGGKRHL